MVKSTSMASAETTRSEHPDLGLAQREPINLPPRHASQRSPIVAQPDPRTMSKKAT